MELVQRFPENTKGRDYVVGDIHGCFGLLRKALHEAGFNPKTDRLFSVGDLVDRGPESEAATEWLAHPWFHAVRGNHEQMAIGVAAGKHDHANYFVNGGGWFLALEAADQARIAAALAELPICIEVETPDGLVGIVHAEIDGYDWHSFTDGLANYQSNNKLRSMFETAMWCRLRIQSGDTTPVSGVTRMYVGHTPMKAAVALGNVHYLDTGACFGRKLTLVCINDQATYEVAA